MSSNQPDEYMNHHFVTCDFCREIQGRQPSVSWMVKNNEKNTINRLIRAGDDSSLYLMPTIGPIVDDHTLLLSEGHLPSLAGCSPDELKEIEVIIENFKQKYHAKKILCFEHGMPTSNGSSGGCGVCHAHLHILPIDSSIVITDTDVDCYYNSKGYKVEKQILSNIKEIGSYNNKNYILVMLDKIYIYVFDVAVESQLMRKFLCEMYISSQQWDWRKARITQKEMEECSDRIASTLGYEVVKRPLYEKHLLYSQ